MSGDSGNRRKVEDPKIYQRSNLYLCEFPLVNYRRMEHLHLYRVNYYQNLRWIVPGFILYLPIKVKHHVFSTEVQKIWVRSWWQIDIPIFGSHHFLKNFHTWCGHFTSQHGWIRLIGCQILPVGHETRILLGVCGWVPTLLVNNINLVYMCLSNLCMFTWWFGFYHGIHHHLSPPFGRICLVNFFLLHRGHANLRYTYTYQHLAVGVPMENSKGWWIFPPIRRNHVRHPNWKVQVYTYSC